VGKPEFVNSMEMRVRRNLEVDPSQDEQLGIAVTFIGLRLVKEARAPLPLWRFSQRLAAEAGVRSSADLARLSDSVKLLLIKTNHPRLAVTQSSSTPGVGYVYDRADPETWPVKSSR